SSDQFAAMPCLLQQPAGFGHGLRGLHGDAAGHAVCFSHAARVFNEIVALNWRQCRIAGVANPAVVSARQLPQVMMGVDHEVGACASIRPADLRSCQNRSGIGALSMRKFSLSSATLLTPGTTLATQGWCSGNCNAAALSGTPCAAHIFSIAWTRARTSAVAGA